MNAPLAKSINSIYQKVEKTGKIKFNFYAKSDKCFYSENKSLKKKVINK